MKPTYEVPLPVRLNRMILRSIFRFIFHVLSDVHIYGLENMPKSGPYIVAFNHISIIDPPFIVSFWPVAAEAVGAVEIWERPFQSNVARWYGGIRVHRGEYDRELINAILAALNSGRPLVIAPEGGRSHLPGLRRALPGVAYVMDKARVPVVPVGIVGSTDDFLSKALHGKRPRLEMRIGCPVMLPPVEGKGEERRLSRQRNADRIMYEIASLLPAEYRGIYASPPDEQFLASTPCRA